VVYPAVYLHPDQGIVELSVTIPEPSRVPYRFEIREDPRCVQLFPLRHDEILQLMGGYSSLSTTSPPLSMDSFILIKVYM